MTDTRSYSARVARGAALGLSVRGSVGHGKVTPTTLRVMSHTPMWASLTCGQRQQVVRYLQHNPYMVNLVNAMFIGDLGWQALRRNMSLPAWVPSYV